MTRSVLTTIILITSCLFNLIVAQNNTSTPYSLFGLGIENKTATGGFTGMGNSGIAHKTNTQINLFNPANLGNISQNSFLFDIGLNGIYSNLKTHDTEQITSDWNISHIAIAFPIMKNLGLSLGLLPYTKVGYDVDVTNYIEGSSQQYLTRISGSGGLNKFYLSSGIQLIDNLNLGIDISFLFGKIEQVTNIYGPSFVSITDDNFYSGAKLKTGLQYKLPKVLNKEFTIGATYELPSTLSGEQTRNTYKSYDNSTQTSVDEEVENDLENFEFPSTFGIGLNTKWNREFTSNLDYKFLNWDNTNQYQNTETYVSQNIYAVGVEFNPLKRLSYWGNVDYRLGANYNSGFLKTSNKNIDSYFLSFGLGLPFSKINPNKLNITYSYGREGTTSNNLIQENFHKLTVNINFIGNWFKKRLFD